MAGCLLMAFAMCLPGFVLGLVFGRWGLFVAIGLFVLSTIFGLLIFPTKPKSLQDEVTRMNISKGWTFSIFWTIGASLGMWLRSSM